MRGLAAAGVLASCLAWCAGADATQIAAGSSHACVALSSGHISCWGENGSGQLGDGSTVNSDIPVEVRGIGDAVEVSTGGEDSCAALSSGHVECWGNNWSGQFGDGPSGTSSDTPVEVPGITTAIQVAVGFEHSCALLSSGHVDCWGAEDLGHIVYERNRPVEVPGIDDATQVVAGRDHSCALLSSGHIECWEENGNGQLGDGSTRPSETPVEVQGVTTAIEIAAGEEHSCALLSSGHVSCWGDNGHGQLGDGTTGRSDVPVEVLGVTDATQLAAGGGDTCALLSSAHVECWGENFYGQLGDGALESSSRPVEVQGITTASQVAVGEGDSCALLASGQADCWGDNESEQLGDSTDGEDSPEPVAVTGLANAMGVAVGYPHSCAVLSSGHVDCWGENSWGQLGDGSKHPAETPIDVLGVTDALQVSASEGDSCAVLASGHADCWGSGELGDGTKEASVTAVEVTGLTNAVQIATSAGGSCALLSSGHVECWGTNEEGELGAGTHGGYSDTPVEVPGLTEVLQVAAGNLYFCAVLSSGHVECWGSNRSGQLGDGTDHAAYAPAEVQGISNATQVGAAYEHTCAVLSAGHVDCWGADYNGQLGDGTSVGSESCEESAGTCNKTPVEVLGISSATRVATGGSDSCALLSSGHVDCWGSNLSGQLGDGLATGPEGCAFYSCDHWDTPVEVEGLTDATQIAVGGNGAFAAPGSTCAVLSGGQLDCWGSSLSGGLGDGLAWSTAPVGVVDLPPETPGPSSTGTGDGAPPLIPSVQEGSAKITTITTPQVTGTGASYLASLRSSSAKAGKNGRLALELGCSDGAATCRGTVSISLTYHPSRHRSRTVLLARARYAVRASSDAKIILTLSRYARALLARGETLHATATITPTPGVAAGKARSRITIHARRR